MNNFGRAGFLMFLASTLIFVNGQEYNCPENMEYVCGPVCPINCTNYYEPIECPGCEYGCFCKEGYVLHATIPGLCVEVEQCPICQDGRCVCKGDNREYNPCGPLRPKTCANCYTEDPCFYLCVPGCFCRDGYVSNYGVCYEKSKCDRGGTYFP